MSTLSLLASQHNTPLLLLHFNEVTVVSFMCFRQAPSAILALAWEKNQYIMNIPLLACHTKFLPLDDALYVDQPFVFLVFRQAPSAILALAWEKKLYIMDVPLAGLPGAAPPESGGGRGLSAPAPARVLKSWDLEHLVCSLQTCHWQCSNC